MLSHSFIPGAPPPNPNDEKEHHHHHPPPPPVGGFQHMPAGAPTQGMKQSLPPPLVNGYSGNAASGTAPPPVGGGPPPPPPPPPMGGFYQGQPQQQQNQPLEEEDFHEEHDSGALTSTINMFASAATSLFTARPNNNNFATAAAREKTPPEPVVPTSYLEASSSYFASTTTTTTDVPQPPPPPSTSQQAQQQQQQQQPPSTPPPAVAAAAVVSAPSPAVKAMQPQTAPTPVPMMMMTTPSSPVVSKAQPPMATTPQQQQQQQQPERVNTATTSTPIRATPRSVSRPRSLPRPPTRPTTTTTSNVRSSSRSRSTTPARGSADGVTAEVLQTPGKSRFRLPPGRSRTPPRRVATAGGAAAGALVAEDYSATTQFEPKRQAETPTKAVGVVEKNATTMIPTKENLAPSPPVIETATGSHHQEVSTESSTLVVTGESPKTIEATAAESTAVAVVGSENVALPAAQPTDAPAPASTTTKELPTTVQPMLPPGWSELLDPSSNRYYYVNESTGETTWEKPACLPQQQQQQQTPESAPSIQSEMTQQQQQPETDKPSSDQSANTVAVPTVSAPEETPQSLGQQQAEVEYSVLDPVPLDSSRPVAATTAVDQQLAQEQPESTEMEAAEDTALSDTTAKHQPTPTSNPEQESEVAFAQLPQGWLQAMEPSSQRLYYYNTVSGETSWTKPEFPTLETTIDKGEAAVDVVEDKPFGDGESAKAAMESPKDHSEIQLGPAASLDLGGQEAMVESLVWSPDAQPPTNADPGEELPEGWVKRVDEASSYAYYYNKITGESRWELPEDVQAAADSTVGETTAEAEPIEANRKEPNLVEEETPESGDRLSRLVDEAPENTNSNVSKGLQPELAAENDGSAHFAAEAIALVESQVIGSFDKDATENDVCKSSPENDLPEIIGGDSSKELDQPVEKASSHEVLDQVTTSAEPTYGEETEEIGNTPRSNPPQEVEALDLPEGWVKLFDDNSNRAYYYNTLTNAASWDPPAVTTSKEGGQTLDESENSEAMNISEAPAMDQEHAELREPTKVWSAVIHEETGQTYYVNSATGDISWEPPHEEHFTTSEAEKAYDEPDTNDEPVQQIDVTDDSIDQDVGADLHNDESSAVAETDDVPMEMKAMQRHSLDHGDRDVVGNASTLPRGWTQLEDSATGDMYFYNEATGESRWDPPPVETPDDHGHVESNLSPLAIDGENDEKDHGVEMEPPMEDVAASAPESPDMYTVQTEKRLPDGWEAVSDVNTGEIYYYNAETGETKWEKPAENDEIPDVLDEKPGHGKTEVPLQLEDESESASPTQGWQKLFDGTTGKPFYFNEETGVTSWDMPAEYNAEPEEESDSLHLKKSTSSHSREEDPADHSEVTEMEQLRGTGESTEDPTDDQAEDALPEGWIMITHPESGDVYYYNEFDETTSWERPGGAAFVSTDATNDDAVVAAPSESTLPQDEALDATPPAEGVNTIEPAEDEPDLHEEEWVEVVDETSGSVYYYNEKTGETSWDKPDNFMSPEDEAEADKPTVNSAELAEPSTKEIDENGAVSRILPDGWEEAVDPDTGSVYYFNESTNETSWDFPVADVAENNQQQAMGTNATPHVAVSAFGKSQTNRFGSRCSATIGFGGRVCFTVGTKIVVRKIHVMTPTEALVAVESAKAKVGVDGPLSAYPSELPQQFITSCAQTHYDDLLWNLIDIISRSKGRLRSNEVGADPMGPFAAIVNLLKKGNELHSDPSGGFVDEQSSVPMLNQHVSDKNSKLKSLETLFIEGRQQEAVEEALRYNEVGVALFLASMAGQELFQYVSKQYAERVFAKGNPLYTLCSFHFAEEEEFSNFGSNFGSDEVLRNSWRRHLIALINNKMPGWQKVVMALGDRLRVVGEYSAAHFCYIVSGTSMGRMSKQATKWTLAGRNVTVFDTALKTDETLEAFLRTEAFEWAKRRANPKAMIKSFQPFKLVYCYILADVGLTSVANAYLNDLLPYFESKSGNFGSSFSLVPLCHWVYWGDFGGLRHFAEALHMRLHPSDYTSAVESEADVSFLTAYSNLESKAESLRKVEDNGGPPEPGVIEDGSQQFIPEPEKQLQAPPPMSASSEPAEKLRTTDSLPEANRLYDTQALPASPLNQVPVTSLQSASPSIPSKPPLIQPPLNQPPRTSPPAMIPSIPPMKQPESGNDSKEKAPSTPAKIAPAPSTAPAELGKQSSTPSRMFGMIKGLFGKSDEDNAVKADLGGKMEAYYDKEKKRWVFPDDDPNAEDPTAGPPPTTLELQTSPVKEEKNEPLDPLSAMMAPPSRAPRSAIPSKRPQVPNGQGMPPGPPKFFIPKQN